MTEPIIQELTAPDLPVLKNFAPPEWNTDLSRTFSFHFGQPYFYPIGCQVDGRIVGCANGLIQGNTGWFGNIIVLPDFRGQGIGGALTRHLVEYFTAKHVDYQVLIATKMGEPVYRGVGFEVTGQYVFLKRAEPALIEAVPASGSAPLQAAPRVAAPGVAAPGMAAPGVRALQPEDARAVLALDQVVTGEQRAPFLVRFLQDAWVHVSNNGEAASEKVDGFFLPRLAHGPVIAANDAAGCALLRQKLELGAGGVVVPEQNTAAMDFLSASGFVETARAPRMSRGKDVPWQPARVFARGSGFCG